MPFGAYAEAEEEAVVAEEEAPADDAEEETVVAEEEVLAVAAEEETVVAEEEAQQFMNDGDMWKGRGFPSIAASRYWSAGNIYFSFGMYSEARNAYENAKECYLEDNSPDLANAMQGYINDLPVTGSTLSEGNLAVVTAVAGVALGLVGGLLIGKKKKSAAE